MEERNRVWYIKRKKKKGVHLGLICYWHNLGLKDSRCSSPSNLALIILNGATKVGPKKLKKNKNKM